MKELGKEPSDIERLIRVVIGMISASRQDLRSLVGIKSEEQVESEARNIALRTSSEVAGEKEERGRGGKGGWRFGALSADIGGSLEQSAVILSSKNCKNEAARADGEEKDGKDKGMLRERRELSVDQSLRG